jgi:phage terminase large subunit-like protein
VNGGTVEILRGAWNRAFLDELAVFPSRAHDDQVDALSGAFAMLTDSPAPILRTGSLTDFKRREWYRPN